MKSEFVYICSECGRKLVKWMGRCPGCGEWNTIVEKKAPTLKTKVAHSALAMEEEWGEVKSLADIDGDSLPRIETGINELDRVLGGGIVPRSVILLAGDPGIGKSTLLMQALGSLTGRGHKVLYVSGEESAQQIKMRAERLALESSDFLALMENRLETILDRLNDSDCSVVVIDSVQSIFSAGVESAPGSVAQVRYAAGRILDMVKRGSTACFLVGHVTKGGDIAGPKLLEHMVDTVLYSEGERNHPYRILRAVKNRFGSVSEIGVFEMGERGLTEVANPSELFLSERPEEASGSTVTALIEGSRPILAEVQALVTGPAPGQGRRTCLGTDSQRLALTVAVMEKKLGLVLGDQDIFVNAVGGVRAVEPASDLAVAAALLSSFTDRVIPQRTLVFGELGLAGEVRRVSRADARTGEAVRLGFNRIIAPASDAEAVRGKTGVTVVGVRHIRELGRLLFEE